jgi:hypothetical protein
MLAKKRPFEIGPFDPFGYAQGRLRTLGTSSGQALIGFVFWAMLK